MMSFVWEKKWTSGSLSIILQWSDNTGKVCTKWLDHKMSQFLSPEAGTSPEHVSLADLTLGQEEWGERDHTPY
jgi:hypothetical protein